LNFIKVKVDATNIYFPLYAGGIDYYFMSSLIEYCMFSSFMFDEEIILLLHPIKILNQLNFVYLVQGTQL